MFVLNAKSLKGAISVLSKKGCFVSADKICNRINCSLDPSINVTFCFDKIKFEDHMFGAHSNKCVAQILVQ